MSEKNVELVKRWFEEVWNQGKEQSIDEMFVKQGKAYGLTEQVAQGPEGFKKFWRVLQTSFSEICFQIEDTVMMEDKIATRWTATMKHTGTFQGYAATGKTVEITGLSFCLLQDNKIFDAWNEWSLFGLMQQIGAEMPPITFE